MISPRKIAICALFVALPLVANAQIVTDDLLYHWDASDGPTSAAGTWDSLTPNTGANGGRWNFDTTGADGVTRDLLSTNNTTFTHAYSFKGGNGVASDSNPPVQSTGIFDGSGGGSTDPFDVGSSALTNTAATFEAWLRPGDLSGNEIVFETGGTTRGVGLTMLDSTLQFSVKDGSTANPPASEVLTTALADTTDFHHVVMTITDTSNTGSGGTQDLALYLDGALVDTGSFNGDHVFGTGNATLAGANSAGSFGGGANTAGAFNLSNFDGFFGDIAAFRVYNDALSAAEVQQNFQASLAAVPEPASIAIWSLIGLGLAGFGYYRTRRKK